MRKNLAMGLVFLPLLIFLTSCYPNTPVVEQRYHLVVTTEGQGLVEPSQGEFLQGTTLTFNIKPAPGWQFCSWGGNNRYEVNNNYGNWQILMNGHKTLTAIFEEDQEPGDPNPVKQHKLNIACLGKGRVVPDSGLFTRDEIVDLFVQPDQGWYFERWEGTAKADVIRKGDYYCLVMDEDKCLIAIFEELKYSLSINIHGEGTVEEKIISDFSNQEEYAPGSIVRLWAKPSPGWLFKEWRYTDGSVDKQNVINLVMDSNKEIRVIFVEEETRYNLEIKVIGKGKVEEKFISDGDYLEGTIVELMAKPASGWEFAGWSGDVKGANPKVCLEMDADKQIIAKFLAQEENYYLDIEVIGKGSVSKSPDYEYYEAGTLVTIKAIPASGWEFQGWQGDYSGADKQIRVQMDENKYIKAIFIEEKTAYYQLDLECQGEGRIVCDPAEHEYKAGSMVTLTAVPADGWEFKEWQGDLSGTNPQGSLRMDEDKKVLARFAKKEIYYHLNLKTDGSGHVTKSPDKETYPAGSVVTLTASPLSGWRFSCWMGDLVGSKQTEQITMDGDKDITAKFIRQGTGYTLQVDIIGPGQVKVFPEQDQYEEYAKVELIAYPEEGHTLYLWLVNGRQQGWTSPLTVYIKSNTVVTAEFKKVIP